MLLACLTNPEPPSILMCNTGSTIWGGKNVPIFAGRKYISAWVANIPGHLGVLFIALCRKKSFLKTCASNSHLKHAANVHISYLLPICSYYYLYSYSVLRLNTFQKTFSVNWLYTAWGRYPGCPLSHILTSMISHVLIKQNQTQTQRFLDTFAQKTNKQTKTNQIYPSTIYSCRNTH